MDSTFLSYKGKKMREIKINLSKIRASLIGFNCLENLIFLCISPQGRKQGIMKREGEIKTVAKQQNLSL